MDNFIEFAKQIEQDRQLVVVDVESVEKVVVDALIDCFLNYKDELNSFLDDMGFEWSADEPEELDSLYKIAKANMYDVENLPNFEVVHAKGGGEGGGEYVERVLKVSSPGWGKTAYIKATGWYSSYEGTEWNDEVTFVLPVAKMIMDFE